MRSFPKRIISLFMAVFVALSCFCVSVSAVESDIPEGNGNMYLDVVFVLDSSGSMLESDPNRVAADAFSLFVDLCDDTCGVGYTIYSHIIKESEKITTLDDKHLSELRNKISGMNRNPQGDTDIALGLNKALELHKLNEQESGDSDRKKAVILLSDGNTHLIDGSKSDKQLEKEMNDVLGTLSEMDGSKSDKQLEKEMNDVLQSLSEMEIPVYAIGLNYDGTLDKKETQKIASNTNGKAYEAKASEELPAIIADIFADVYEIKGDKKEIKDDGSVEVYIKDKSVSYVNLVIRSKLSLDQLNLKLLTPRREEVDISGNDENFVVTSTGSYILIKMVSPMSGRWKLVLDEAANNENCIVTQLDFYSMYVKQNITDLDNTLIVGESTGISASLYNESGIVRDKTLTENVKMITTVSGNGETKTIELSRQDNNVFAGNIFLDTEGTYIVVTTAQSDNFNKQSTPITLVAKKYTEEEIAKIRRATGGDGEVSRYDMSEHTPVFSPILIISAVLTAAILGVIILIVALKLKERKDQLGLSLARATPHEENTEPPAPPAPPIEKVKPMADPGEPEYVNVPLVEHGSLESLIKKGPDDAFNSNSDAYQTDASLEAIIKKGPDNDLGFGSTASMEELNEFDNTEKETYQSGHDFSSLFGGFDNQSGGVDLNKK